MDLQLLTDALNKLTPQVFTYDRSIQSLKKGTRIIRKHPPSGKRSGNPRPGGPRQGY